jgi:hypothetical protein
MSDVFKAFQEADTGERLRTIRSLRIWAKTDGRSTPSWRLASTSLIWL